MVVEKVRFKKNLNFGIALNVGMTFAKIVFKIKLKTMIKNKEYITGLLKIIKQ